MEPDQSLLLLRQIEQRLNQRFDDLEKTLGEFTCRFDKTESQVDDIHLVHECVKRTEAAYTRYHHPSGARQQMLLPDTTYELEDESDYATGHPSEEEEEEEEEEEGGNYGNIGPVGTVPTMMTSLTRCCSVQ